MPQVEQPKPAGQNFGSRLLSRKFLLTLGAAAGAAWIFYDAMQRGDLVTASNALDKVMFILGPYLLVEGAADVAGRWQAGKASAIQTEITTRSAVAAEDEPSSTIVPGNQS